MAKDPEDLDVQAVLRVQLRKLLERDKVLTAEMARLVESSGDVSKIDSGGIAQGKRAVAAGAGGIAIGVDIGREVRSASRDRG